MLTAALSLAISLPAAAHDTKEFERALLGTWKSAAAEDLGNGTFGTRTFVLKDGHWSIVFTCYADAKLATPLFAFEAVGPWKAGEAVVPTPPRLGIRERLRLGRAGAQTYPLTCATSGR
jgi:hypothetical protein